jgi:2-keto-4-pentenoate hydratase
MITPGARERVASELVDARREGRSLARFPGPVPATMADAYQIQDVAISRWPDAVVGWKIGYIPADRRSPGDPDRLVGPIWSRQCHATEDAESPVEVDIFPSGFAAVEGELVIRLRQELPAHQRSGWTADETAELDQEVLVGIEVASSPVPDINALGPTVIAADFGNNNGLVLGSALARGSALAVRLASRVDGQLVGMGSAQDLPGGIHQGLATALNILARRGQVVRGGMVFATGAITGIHPVGPRQHCRVDVEGGPSVVVRTVDARDTARGT